MPNLYYLVSIEKDTNLVISEECEKKRKWVSRKFGRGVNVF